jgi:phosphohistidine phosphatase
MKRLVLVRHAKAVHWGYEDDFNRELTGRGETDARKMGKFLKKTGICPDLIITSPASRAFQTAGLFSEELNYPADSLQKKPELYHGLTTGELVDFIHTFPAETNCVFLFGHNPSFEYYAHGLCRSFDGDMPTASAVVIDFEADTWPKVTTRSGRLFARVCPKELPV